MSNEFRIEKDMIGTKEVPREALYGIHSVRACENFPFTNRAMPESMIRAYGAIKSAALTTAKELKLWKDRPEVADALIVAATELSSGALSSSVIVPAMQGGAGTSLNMNVNEVISNRALQILGKECGDYATISPTDDANCYQSTNDTYPTALRLAAIQGITIFEERLVTLQESFQAKEMAFSHITKVGRTQLQEAVLTTLGREMSTYAEAINRDRWRVYKCTERLRSINLGGTAIGSGIGAERKYIFSVVEKLREITGIGFARSENLLDATANCDLFVEVSGILKASATTLLKIASDLRLLTTFGEITLPAVQAGSSIMAGKVNPVIPEAVIQSAMTVIANDSAITQGCAAGNLELNPFLPLVCWNLLDSIELLTVATTILSEHCVTNIVAHEERCRQSVESSTATITALISVLGYTCCSEIAAEVKRGGKSVREVVLNKRLCDTNGNIIDSERFDSLISADAVCQLGFRKQSSR